MPRPVWTAEGGRLHHSMPEAGSAHCAPKRLAGNALRPRGIDVAEVESGAGEGTRTLGINLGKVALYQLSYARSGRVVAAAREGSSPVVEVKVAIRERLPR